MAWRDSTPFERNLLEDVRDRWPEILPLARHLCLAPRVEPLLMRNVRHRFVPQAATEIESLLWFSPLVAARSTREIVLHLGVARLLADELLSEPDADARLETLWQYTCRHTRHWSVEDRLERDLRYHALRADDADVREKLQTILRRLRQETDAEQYLKLSRLVKRALPVIGPAFADMQEARWLAQYAAQALGDAGAWVNPGPPTAPPRWLAEKLPAPQENSELSVEIRHDSEHGQMLHFLAPQADLPTLRFTHPLPARLHIAAEGEVGAWHPVAAGVRIPIQPASPHLTLATLEGARWDLRTPALPIAESDRPVQPILSLAHVEADREQAEALARWLAEQGLDVRLLPETQAAAAMEAAPDARILRLWTQAAKRHWASGTAQPPTLGGVLLRIEEVDLPGAGALGGLLDWRDWQRFGDSPDARRLLESLTRWLEHGEVPSAPEEAADADPVTDEIARLLAEIANPETTPPRRLEIGDRLAELGDPRPGVGVREIEVVDEAGYVEPGYWEPGYAEPVTGEPETASGYSAEVTRLLAEIANPETIPPRRLEIGDRLAELGDPRPGVGLDARGLPDIDWVEIPGGPFIYQKGETRQLPSFWIARYPVTNLQYQTFIDDGGYREKRWWDGLPRPKREKPTWTQPNRPRTNIDWREAVAFSRWLGARLDLKEGELRLPSEEEWEKAARGSDGLAYPWGEEYRAGYANVNEKKTKAEPWYLKQTTAVGVYPHGRSPQGVEDLAGTVWEWNLNMYEKPKEIGVYDSGGGQRVLRGGSWFNYPALARADFRYWYSPVDRGFDVGFRLVCLVPIAAAVR